MSDKKKSDVCLVTLLGQKTLKFSGVGVDKGLRKNQRRTMEEDNIAYLKHKNGTKDYHHDGITCGEYSHGFNTVLPCINICRSDNGSEIWNRYCKVDRDCENIRR